MAIEIELKVRVDDPESIKRQLFSLGIYRNSYKKSDTYWSARAALPSGVRVRRETITGTDGKNCESVLITYKTKKIRDGIEINDERECTVSDAAVFEELLDRMGLKPGLRKEKQGWAWAVSDTTENTPILAELSRVKGLGWFLELEILEEKQDQQTVTESRKRLLSLLERLEIGENQIESRTYTEMLLHKTCSNTL